MKSTTTAAKRNSNAHSAHTTIAMKMNTALHNVSFVWNFIFYSSFKHFPYKTEDYAQSNSRLFARYSYRWHSE